MHIFFRRNRRPVSTWNPESRLYYIPTEQKQGRAFMWLRHEFKKTQMPCRIIRFFYLTT
jgi:hypothetical protein